MTSETLKSWFHGQTLAAAVQRRTHQKLNYNTTLTTLTKLTIFQMLNIGTGCSLFDPPKHTNPIQFHLIFQSDSNWKVQTVLCVCSVYLLSTIKVASRAINIASTSCRIHKSFSQHKLVPGFPFLPLYPYSLSTLGGLFGVVVLRGRHILSLQAPQCIGNYCFALNTVRHIEVAQRQARERITEMKRWCNPMGLTAGTLKIVQDWQGLFLMSLSPSDLGPKNHRSSPRQHFLWKSNRPTYWVA